MNVEDMIKRSFSEFSMQRAVNGKDIHKALVKYERFYRLINDQISNEMILLNAKGDSDFSTGPPVESLYRDIYNSFVGSYRLTQCFINFSFSQHPIDMETGKREKDGKFLTVPLPNIALAVAKGRIIFSNRNNFASIAVALSSPIYYSVCEAEGVPTSNKGGGFSDVRRNLITSSAVTANASKSKAKAEKQIEDARKTSFIYALLLVPPAGIAHDGTSGDSGIHVDSDSELSGECDIPDSDSVKYAIVKMLLTEIALISSVTIDTNVSLECHSSKAVSETVRQLYEYVAPISAKSNSQESIEVSALDLQRALRRTDVDAAVIQNELDANSVFLLSSKFYIICLYPQLVLTLSREQLGEDRFVI